MKRTAIVTGGNSGLGLECVKSILKESDNYRVIIACRSTTRGQEAIDTLGVEFTTRVEVMALDLASLDSVRKFTASYKVLPI